MGRSARALFWNGGARGGSHSKQSPLSPTHAEVAEPRTIPGSFLPAKTDYLAVVKFGKRQCAPKALRIENAASASPSRT